MKDVDDMDLVGQLSSIINVLESKNNDKFVKNRQRAVTSIKNSIAYIKLVNGAIPQAKKENDEKCT